MLIRPTGKLSTLLAYSAIQ